MMQLLDPISGSPLAVDGAHTLRAADERRWPVVDGIPFLRLNRDKLIDAIFARLDEDDTHGALILALADRDDHAKGPPPGDDALARLADGQISNLREAMQTLNFGPVADYFAHRWSAPTFLSGLSLLADYWKPGQPVVEVACGLGQLLREAVNAGAEAIGVDVVFSKLWLARRYVLGANVPLLCADIQHGVPLTLDTSATTLCHDALYFIQDKSTLVAEMQRLAGPEGSVLIGHAHNSQADQRGITGWPLAPAEWAAHLPGAMLYDDRQAASAWIAGELARPTTLDALATVEAISMARGMPNPIPQPIGAARRGVTTRLNPLLHDRDGALCPNWPTDSLAREYADADYLSGERLPTAPVIAAAGRGEISQEIDRLVRRRVLLDLPEAW